MFNIPKSIQKSCCNAENKKRHCEPQAWQSQSASTIYNKESETPLTAVGTLTALLRNSTKVMENLSQKVRSFKGKHDSKVVENLLQKVALCKVLSISVITLFFSLIATTESLAETTCSWSGTTLTVSGTGTFSGCPGYAHKNATEVIIENGVTSIGYGAFAYARSLTSVNIPNSVTSIGSEAFNNATSLASVNIPNSVTSIGDYVFSSTALTSVTIPDSVTSIGYAAFRSSRSLTSVNIPNSVTSIGNMAFYDTQISKCSLSALDKCHLPCTNGTSWNGTACVAMTCADVYPDSSETQCESSVSGCSVTTCDEVGSLADGTKCYKAATVDHTPNCNTNASIIGEGASCACVCNTGFEGSGTTCTAISCPAGKYLDGSECKTCAAGTYAEAGDNVCSSCGAHEYSAAGASSCLPRQNFSNCNEFSTDSDECTSCKTGYTAENGGCVSLCSGGKVYWDGECYDEYPFAKKRYTPAEAAPWLKDNGNIVTLIFKK